MTHLNRALALSAAIFLITTGLVPAALLAQSVVSTATSSVVIQNDGSTDSPAQQSTRVRAWRGEDSQLSSQIAALGSTPIASVPIPVLLGVSLSNISPNFGDPRPGGRTHEGEDIMAVSGTPIVSPTPAVVLRTETGASEGNAVYTANPGGETFVYMHLDHFGEGVLAGTILNTGDLIGYVGNTGDASGGAAHLHFEIHNSSGAPTDPYPRLASEFSAEQKMSYLSGVLAKTSNPSALANFLVTNFRASFKDANARGIALPPLITGALSSIPDTGTSSGGLPAGDLQIGSSGSAVVALQNRLIASATGPAAQRLAAAGATGNFGAITQAALIEYQTAHSIAPANGYYGAATRALIESSAPSTPVSNTPAAVSGSASGIAALTRDLKLGLQGDDVRELQIILNKLGYQVAASGPGAQGSESTYFGPATQAAVVKFQSANGVSPAAGYVGSLTRAALSNALAKIH